MLVGSMQEQGLCWGLGATGAFSGVRRGQAPQSIPFRSTASWGGRDGPCPHGEESCLDEEPGNLLL